MEEARVEAGLCDFGAFTRPSIFSSKEVDGLHFG